MSSDHIRPPMSPLAMKFAACYDTPLIVSSDGDRQYRICNSGIMGRPPISSPSANDVLLSLRVLASSRMPTRRSMSHDNPEDAMRTLESSQLSVPTAPEINTARLSHGRSMSKKKRDTEKLNVVNAKVVFELENNQPNSHRETTIRGIPLRGNFPSAGMARENLHIKKFQNSFDRLNSMVSEKTAASKKDVFAAKQISWDDDVSSSWSDDEKDDYEMHWKRAEYRYAMSTSGEQLKLHDFLVQSASARLSALSSNDMPPDLTPLSFCVNSSRASIIETEKMFSCGESANRRRRLEESFDSMYFRRDKNKKKLTRGNTETGSYSGNDGGSSSIESWSDFVGQEVLERSDSRDMCEETINLTVTAENARKKKKKKKDEKKSRKKHKRKKKRRKSRSGESELFFKASHRESDMSELSNASDFNELRDSEMGKENTATIPMGLWLRSWVLDSAGEVCRSVRNSWGGSLGSGIPILKIQSQEPQSHRSGLAARNQGSFKLRTSRRPSASDALPPFCSMLVLNVPEHVHSRMAARGYMEWQCTLFQSRWTEKKRFCFIHYVFRNTKHLLITFCGFMLLSLCFCCAHDVTVGVNLSETTTVIVFISVLDLTILSAGMVLFAVQAFGIVFIVWQMCCGFCLATKLFAILHEFLSVFDSSFADCNDEETSTTWPSRRPTTQTAMHISGNKTQLRNSRILKDAPSGEDTSATATGDPANKVLVENLQSNRLRGKSSMVDMVKAQLSTEPLPVNSWTVPLRWLDSSEIGSQILTGMMNFSSVGIFNNISDWRERNLSPIGLYNNSSEINYQNYFIDHFGNGVPFLFPTSAPESGLNLSTSSLVLSQLSPTVHAHMHAHRQLSQCSDMLVNQAAKHLESIFLGVIAFCMIGCMMLIARVLKHVILYETSESDLLFPYEAPVRVLSHKPLISWLIGR